MLLIGPCGGARNTPKRSDCVEEVGRGRLTLLWFPEQQTPYFLSTKYAWTAGTGGGTRERRPIENAEIRLLALISLWKTIISFFFRDLFV